MKKRILLVDDEDLILQGLQRMLRPLRTAWEMDFVTSGQQALDLFARTPYDVVVSDMRMPGMSGAELMNEVMRLYPRSIRLILSGHADRDLVLKCVGATHQYLSKPCDPDVLRTTIERATALEDRLQSPNLRLLATRVAHLPSLPTLYFSVMKAAQKPEVPLSEIGEIIAQDIGMTAQVLKLVNSAFFGLRRKVCSPMDAASYLGIDLIKSLILGIHAFSQLASQRCGEFSAQALWQHSLACGTLARKIAIAENQDPIVAESSFVAGLLHDTGELVLAANFPTEAQEALFLAQERGIETTAAEEEIVGSGHGDIGGYLLGLWGLPTPIVEAVTLHHSPSQSSDRSFSALTAVHVADVLAGSPASDTGPQPAGDIDMGYLEGLNLTHRLPAWRALATAHSEEQEVA